MGKKNILILSGVHGSEQAAVKVGMMLSEKFKNVQNIGVMPQVNRNALINNSREFVNKTRYDSLDLNRSLIDEFGPTLKEIKDNLICEISDSDIVIDIHNSPDCANFFLVDLDENNEKICSILQQTKNVQYASRHTKGGTIKDYVNNQKDKIGFTYEFGGMQLTGNCNINKAYQDILNLVNQLQSDDDADFTYQPNEIKEFNAPMTGYYEYHIRSNDIVEPGKTLFNILNENNEVMYTEKLETRESIRVLSIGNNFESKGSSIILFNKIK